MFLKRNTCFMVFLLCSLTLWCKSTSAGSSYLSPSQKPQNKGRSSRVGRQLMEPPGPPAEENHITISAPFEIGFTVREQDFEEYGTALQEVIQRLLGNTDPAAGRPHFSVLYIKKVVFLSAK
ncbi:ghrelin/obestatin prepropeptide [Trematomus bernacchii]|uniref:ghrelin/obestatin prepropeptide n=1 Tax=Trematomus bernacchii TaxID=40690 RepID=UPI00146EC948|nr:ghrelin/obestatin prepropeptide [Trematomus bernacchii]